MKERVLKWAGRKPKAAREGGVPALVVQGKDREFLPSALEILETPPSPAAVGFLLTICAFAAVALAWSFIGKLDVHAVAPGKIKVTGESKVVQPYESGKVSAIHVANGQPVKSGDVLLELDGTEPQADLEAARIAFFSAKAETGRRNSAVAVAKLLAARDGDDNAISADVATLSQQAVAGREETDLFTQDVPEAIRMRQAEVLNADLQNLRRQMQVFKKQIEQKSAQKQRLDMSIAYEKQLLETLDERVTTREGSLNRRLGTKLDVFDAREQLERAQAQLASDQGQLIETEAALAELRSERLKAIAQFLADNENAAADAERRMGDAEQSTAKASKRLAHTKLIAPVDGTAEQLAVTTIGQVVTSGQQLVVIAPAARTLQVEALVANMDIGFVKPGQDATIKVDAFPFTRFGTLAGRVVHIASEAVSETEAKRALSNVTLSNASIQPQPSAPGQPESFVFPVIVELPVETLQAGGMKMPLSPGMTVSVEIRTDSRRLIDYILSPLSKLASEAMRER